MGSDQIEREVLVQAGISEAWALITDPSLLSKWFCDDAKVDLREGGEGTLWWREDGVAKSEPGSFVVSYRIERIDAPRLFSFRWAYPAGEEPRADNSALVEFALEATSAGTRVRLTETGTDSLSGDAPDPEKYMETHGRGWDIHLGSLVEFARKQMTPASA
jgi:uncharacterized protein YndB with AHSA1/START domain